ncbi:MAG: SH3 domain-containing protein [Candidatus Omnitrophica bacterium]|nr:SH3 domain-containing protein [Candidatus Omnitrophota bacterium]MDD5670837.1 SH3 domain-containing protein [Candidatus Omnitrophota bacterium]
MKLRIGIVSVWIAMAFLLMGRSLWALSPNDIQRFEKANEAYRSGHFQEAMEDYRDLSKKYPQTGIFCYNLGNSYFRLGQIGMSIWAYERGLLSDPRNHDIRSNLKYVRSLLEYRIDDNRNWYLRVSVWFLERLTTREVKMLLAFCYFLLMSSWGLALYFWRDAPWRWKRKTLAVLLGLALLLFIAKYWETRVFRDAIVITQQAEIRYGPSESDQVAFRLGEGLNVSVVDQREDWSRIVLVNGEGGWVKNDQIVQVMS